MSLRAFRKTYGMWSSPMKAHHQSRCLSGMNPSDFLSLSGTTHCQFAINSNQFRRSLYARYSVAAGDKAMPASFRYRLKTSCASRVIGTILREPPASIITCKHSKQMR